MTDETKRQIAELEERGLISKESAEQLRRPVGEILSEMAARERLGTWLAAEPGRCWDCDLVNDDEWTVYLELSAGVEQASAGTGPTLAAAIIAALEIAQQ